MYVVVGLVETVLSVGGLIWAVFGRTRDLRINGVLVPPIAQAALRLTAPAALLGVLLITSQLENPLPTSTDGD